MGPPFVVIPYLPLAFFSFATANYILMILNVLCFFLAFILLWKMFIKKISYLFWIFSGLLFFTLPVSYGLGMGNPMGIVTLGCFSLILFSEKRKLASTLITFTSFLKIFPLVSIPAYILLKPRDEKMRIYIYINIIIFSLLSFFLLPKDSWKVYIHQFFQQYLSNANPDISIYNQSFISSLSRVGTNMPLLLIPFILVLTFFVIVITRKIYKSHLFIQEKLFQVTVLFLAFFLLIHPFPWQYYFSIFIPFLFIQIAKKEYIYIPALFLMSLDGNKIDIDVLKGIINSSQFIATCTLVFTIYWYVNKKR
jgi:hypothetical protein